MMVKERGRERIAGSQERRSEVCSVDCLVMKLDEEAKKYGDVEAFGWVKTTALDVMTLLSTAPSGSRGNQFVDGRQSVSAAAVAAALDEVHDEERPARMSAKATPWMQQIYIRVKAMCCAFDNRRNKQRGGKKKEEEEEKEEENIFLFGWTYLGVVEKPTLGPG